MEGDVKRENNGRQISFLIARENILEDIQIDPTIVLLPFLLKHKDFFLFQKTEF